jgi:uncharacterized protein (DUF1330 family)
MPAYVIGRLQIRDSSWVEKYAAGMKPLLQKYGGRYLARAAEMETLEGDEPLPSAAVILEFPSLEQARAWYGDPEYASLIALRQSGSDAGLILMDGLPAGGAV